MVCLSLSVCLFVFLLVTFVSHAKTAEPIELPIDGTCRRGTRDQGRRKVVRSEEVQRSKAQRPKLEARRAESGRGVRFFGMGSS